MCKGVWSQFPPSVLQGSCGRLGQVGVECKDIMNSHRRPNTGHNLVKAAGALPQVFTCWVWPSLHLPGTHYRRTSWRSKDVGRSRGLWSTKLSDPRPPFGSTGSHVWRPLAESYLFHLTDGRLFLLRQNFSNHVSRTKPVLNSAFHQNHF